MRHVAPGWSIAARFVILSVAILGVAHAAPSAGLDGVDALAVAAIVGEQSPSLRAGQKTVLSGLADGNAQAAPKAQAFSVTAKSIQCRVSNVDITRASCELEIGGALKDLTGARARAFFEILKAVGVDAQGAAGSQYVTLTNLRCQISPKAVAEEGGAGVTCAFQAGE